MIPERLFLFPSAVSGDFQGLEPGPETTFGSYGPKWSSVSNAPFRMHKNWVHEGGISSPFIVHWPNGIAKKGELRFQRGHIMDIMATCIDISGAEYPIEFGINKIKPLQGTSLVPTFENNTIKRNGPLFWEHEGNRAIVKGKWKLVSAYPGSWSSLMGFEYNGNWELYDMETDRTETRNLSDQFPEIVQELAEEWNDWADKNGVVPIEELGLETYK